MNPEIKQNFIEKLRLVSQDLLDTLDQDIKVMLAEHSRDGLVRSGATIKKTMNFIAKGNANLYHEVLGHLGTLKTNYYPQLEYDVQEFANEAQESFKKETLTRLKKSTEIAGNPQLYERMLPDVENSMATDLAKFQNSLNALALELKLNTKMPPTIKALWALEAALLLVSVFIAGMWYVDPEGNYEPILVALGLVISLMAIGIKFGAKK